MKNLLLLFLALSASSVCKSQWIKQTVTTEASFRSVHAVNADIVWAGGTKGTVIKTLNAGQSWEVFQVKGAEALDFRDIHAFDGKSAVAMSAGDSDKGAAKIYKTIDGGNNWELVFQTDLKGVFFDGIDFWDAKNGIAFSDPIGGKFYLMGTADGGQTWKKIESETLPETKEGEAAFAASGTSLVTVGKSSVFICTGGSETGRIFRSNDRGINWTVVETPIKAGKTTGLFGLRFWDEYNGIAVGGDYQNVNLAGNNVLITSDGGEVWKEVAPTQPEGLKEGVILFQKKVLVTVGPSGTSYSKDFGKSWIEIDRSSFHAISTAGKNIWAVGGKGNIARLDIKILK